MEVIGVGIATIDVICDVDSFPEEDSKIRATGCRKSRGGNVTNALVVCSQLGRPCRWLGTTTDPAKDDDAAFVHRDLAQCNVDPSLTTIVPSGAMPLSYIIASKSTGTRTIVHHRDLPELAFDAFRDRLSGFIKDDCQQQRWIHFEGRNLVELRRMIEYVHDCSPLSIVSLEIEAMRNDWDAISSLIPLVHYVFASKDYVRKKLGHRDAESFLAKQAQNQNRTWKTKSIICPWGSDGVFFYDFEHSRSLHVNTRVLRAVKDSIGAGDALIGASIACLASRIPLDSAMRIAVDVATKKCEQFGFRFEAHAIEEFMSSITNAAKSK